MDKLKRNTLKKSLLLGTLPILTSCNQEVRDVKTYKYKKIKIKMVTSFPKNLPGADLPAQKLAKKIYQISDGLIDIKHYAAGELVPAFEVFDAVSSGTAECGVSAPYYWMSKDISIPFFCTIPGGMTALEKFIWLSQGEGQHLWDELYSKYNLKGLPMGNTGTTMGGWFKKKINSINDFTGLKMRIPGLGGEVINRMGGIATNISGSEVINALKLGVIDAAEWAGPWPDMSMGFHKVAKYYYGPGVHEPGTLNEFMFNKDVWENLPILYKKIITNASYASYLEGISEVFYNNAKSLILLKEKYNIQVNNYPKKIIKKMLEISRNIVEEKSRDNIEYKKIYDSWHQHLNLFNSFHKVSEQEYLKYRV